MDVNTAPYFNALNTEIAAAKEAATFLLEDRPATCAIEFQRTETAPEVPEIVVPADYRNCIGIITYIFDIIIAFIIRCLRICSREEKEETHLPAVSYELTEKKVVLMESRPRGLKEAEIGLEHRALVGEITKCVLEVDDTFTQKRAIEIAMKVVSEWKNFELSSEAQRNDPTFKASSEMTTALTQTYKLGGSKIAGYQRPPVTVERLDQIRDGKLHQSKLRVILPYTEQRIDEEVVLFNGVVFGEESTSKREMKSAPSMYEGLSLQLGNDDWILKSHIASATGEDETLLTNGVLLALKTTAEIFMPQSGEITLHKLSSGLTGYSLHANELMFSRLNAPEAVKVEDVGYNQAQIEAKAHILEESLTTAVGEGYIVSCELQRAPSESKWQMQINFIKADKK